MTTFYIYSLIDPRNNEVKYIGATMDPKARLASHISTSQGTPAKLEWLKELQEESLKPVMQILEECETPTIAAAREQFHYNQNNFGQLVCSNPEITFYKYTVTKTKPRKIPVSFRLSAEVMDLLAQLAERDHRSIPNMLATLIREKAAAMGITAPKS